MPSLSFISTIVMAVLAVTPTLAQTPPRGRPNHADLYGYPHNRGPPPPGPRKPMRPGQYMDPRPANPGAQCRYNNQCSTAVKNAIASCGTDGVCTFKCLGATTFDGTTCAGDIVNPNPRCSFDRQCSTTVSDATGRCVAGRCTFACNRGFYAPNPNATACSPASLECGGQTCPEIPGGYSLCRDGQCLARCEGQLGFKQFCNADNSVCECINVANDTNNCGTPGNVCPPSYNGKGRAFCAAGQCGLSCYRLTKVQPRDAPAYCT